MLLLPPPLLLSPPPRCRPPPPVPPPPFLLPPFLLLSSSFSLSASSFCSSTSTPSFTSSSSTTTSSQRHTHNIHIGSYLMLSCAKTQRYHPVNTLQCFHTRKNHAQATLGFGLSLEFYPRLAGDSSSNSPARLAYAHTTSDLLSYDAFEAHGLRTNLWKADFTHWFPVSE
jgi:hypothetical protein